MLALAGLAACSGGGGESNLRAEADAVEPDAGEIPRESMRRDMLGSAIARGPAWIPGSALYTEEQALRGEELFLTYCTACHGLDEMTSEKMRDNWAGRTVGDFYEYVRYAMPYDVPGRLSAEENADLVAFLFRENGLSAGRDPLPPDAGSLQELRLTHPDSVSTAR